MTTLRLTLLLSLSTAFVASAHAAPRAKAKPSTNAVKLRSAKAKSQSRSTQPRLAKTRLLATGKVKPATAGATPKVKSATLQSTLQRAQKKNQANYAGIFRDLRYRAPHQKAINASVRSILRAATKNVRQSESPQLVAALDALRVYKNKNSRHLSGDGDPQQIAYVFSKMRPLLHAVYQAANLPPIAETDVSFR